MFSENKTDVSLVSNLKKRTVQLKKNRENSEGIARIFLSGLSLIQVQNMKYSPVTVDNSIIEDQASQSLPVNFKFCR